MKRIVSIISFFVFSGFYAVLALIIALGLTNSSRLITVPLRVVTTVLMLYVITKVVYRVKVGNYKKWILFVFCTFWFIYILKVLQNSSAGVHLYRNWFEYIFYAANFCILPFIMFMLIDFKKYSHTILNSLIFSGFLMGIVSLFLYRNILTAGVGRISMAKYSGFESPTLSPLALSYAGTLTIVLCIYVLLFYKNISKKYKIYLYITIFLSAIMFFLGASRGSVVALVLSMPILFYYGNIKNKVRFAFIFILSVPLLIWGALKTGSAVFTRTMKTADGYKINARGELWTNAWTEFVEHPIFGGRIEIGFYPHNFILETLMATGIIGFVLLLLFLLPAFKRVFMLASVDKNYIWVFIVLIQGFTQHFFTGAIYTAMLLFFPLGMIFSLKKT